MLISDAMAAPGPTSATTATTTTVTQDAPSSPLAGMAPLLLIPIVLYVLMIRPNQKKIREYETMVKALRRGDKVVTGGGIVGVISKVDTDDTLLVEIAPDVKVRVVRETISNVITKTAVNDNKMDDKPRKSDDKVSGN